MDLAEKLQLLRNKNRLSQEELAEKLGISRQAISKWESGQSTPDLKKLIIISNLYNVTIDSLVKESDEFETLQSNEINYREEKEPEKIDDNKTQVVINLNRGSIEYEYKSKRELFGLPLVHINIGRGLKKAKGILAVGKISYGLVSVGLISFGILSFGLIGIGLFSLAVLAIGALLAVGSFSVGIFSIGAISIGMFSIGAVAIGKYSVGAAAIASDIAIGDYAKANIAIGNKVEGINTLSLDASVEKVNILIKQVYPHLKDWILNIVHFFVKMEGRGF
ncbi:helix-turn-helix domain-containing protein [Clostridium oceanicum]|uniref:HTH cro/C1-type domain-containing protein n=1 Tax=Clostridium oceanicum TaxID=1543 RepID=A0ABN1JFK4_9CLOT